MTDLIQGEKNARLQDLKGNYPYKLKLEKKPLRCDISWILRLFRRVRKPPSHETHTKEEERIVLSYLANGRRQVLEEGYAGYYGHPRMRCIKESRAGFVSTVKVTNVSQDVCGSGEVCSRYLNLELVGYLPIHKPNPREVHLLNT